MPESNRTDWKAWRRALLGNLLAFFLPGPAEVCRPSTRRRPYERVRLSVCAWLMMAMAFWSSLSLKCCSACWFRSGRLWDGRWRWVSVRAQPKHEKSHLGQLLSRMVHSQSGYHQPGSSRRSFNDPWRRNPDRVVGIRIGDKTTWLRVSGVDSTNEWVSRLIKFNDSC